MKSLPVLFACFFCSQSIAAIINTTGAVTISPTPSDERIGHFENNTQIRAFAERQGITLVQSEAVDVTVPSTFPLPGNENLSPGMIPSGATVSSYLTHYDPVGSLPSASSLNALGSITFDTDILGVVIVGDTLTATNSPFGLPGVIYETNGLNNIELGGGSDSITLSPDRRTLTMNLFVGPNSDDIRIITAAAVPEPSSLASIVLAAGLLGVQRRKRRNTPLEHGGLGGGPEAETVTSRGKKTKVPRSLIAVGTAFLSGLISSPSLAGIINTSGAVQVIAPPSDVRTDILESNTTIFTFAEQQNVALSHDIGVDISVPGTSPASPSDPHLNPATIPLGTGISSYFVHFDRVGSPDAFLDLAGSLTFDSDILGIILLVDSLNATHTMPGLPGTMYATGDHSGVEFGNDGFSTVTLNPDRRTLDFTLAVNHYADNIRVITAVPEPASGLFLLAGSCICLRRWRR